MANHLHLSWDTVKDIQKRYLYRHYNYPDIRRVRHIGIDEFAVAKGHIYKTIVVNLETGRVIYIGDGKGGDALNGFWKKVGKSAIRIEAVATDLSPTFISAVMSNLPKATLVFEHFHVVKLMNDALDEIRRGIYREEKDLNKRKVIKGRCWLLLCNGKNIFDNKHKSILDNVLHMNEPLMKAYYLKESRREIWTQINKEQAAEVLDKWIEQAYQAKIPKLTTMANTLKAHKWGILAWYDYHKQLNWKGSTIKLKP